VSLLLESLFHDTLCGTIILWKARDPLNRGHFREIDPAP